MSAQLGLVVVFGQHALGVDGFVIQVLANLVGELLELCGDAGLLFHRTGVECGILDLEQFAEEGLEFLSGVFAHVYMSSRSLVRKLASQSRVKSARSRARMPEVSVSSSRAMTQSSKSRS